MAAPTYPLTMPTTPAYRTSRWALQRRTAMSQSPFTGNQQVAEYDFALWTTELNLPPMNRESASAWQAFLLQLHGKRGTFLLGDPDAKNPRGAVTGTITLDGGVSIGDYEVQLNSATQTSTSNIVKAGDYLQIGGGSAAKLHMICADASSDSNGDFTVQIEPAIKASGNAGASVVLTNAQGVFRLSDDLVGWDANEVSVYGITLACIEAL